MNSQKIYLLLQELIRLEKQKLWTKNSTLNLDIENVWIELKRVSTEIFPYDLDTWIYWFINNSNFNDEEKTNLNTAYRLLKIEKTSISMLDAEGKLKQDQ